MEKEKTFNRRAFISIGMFISGIGLPVSGIMNHYLGFEKLTVERHAWMSAHNILALLFVIFAVMHIKLNWKSLAAAFKKHSEFILSREAAGAALLVLGIVGLFVMHTLHLRG